MITKDLEKKTLKLNPIDKIHLVEKILESLDKPDPAIEQAWAEESEKRYKRYKKGLSKGSTLETVKKRLQK